MDCWIDKGTYLLNTAPQGSVEWLNARKNRLTASNYGAAVGLSKFSNPRDIALRIAGLIEENFREKTKEIMAHGSKHEILAREWYCKSRNVSVEEVGLAVPKWDHRIGASVDGDVVGTDGIIEIKAPLRMYQPLVDIIENGSKNGDNDYSHIWATHYAQMQGCMKVLGKKWCDYIVFATESNKVYVQRIPYDENYWEKELYPKIEIFLCQILLPIQLEGKESMWYKNYLSESKNIT